MHRATESEHGFAMPYEPTRPIKENYMKPICRISAYDVFSAYNEGDPIAVSVLQKAVEMWYGSSLVSLLNPQKVIWVAAYSALPAIHRRHLQRSLQMGAAIYQHQASRICTFNCPKRRIDRSSISCHQKPFV